MKRRVSVNIMQRVNMFEKQIEDCNKIKLSFYR